MNGDNRLGWEDVKVGDHRLKTSRKVIGMERGRLWERKITRVSLFGKKVTGEAYVEGEGYGGGGFGWGL